MKRKNHITINLNDDEYNLIKKLAAADRRSVSDIAYLILIDNAMQLYQSKQSAEIKPAYFIPLKKDYN
jgi:uncharacterized protein (DUF1778 family)